MLAHRALGAPICIVCGCVVRAASQDTNLLAAGHDGGMIVFKLDRERPPYTSLPNGVLFLKERYVRMHEYASSKEMPLMTIRRPSSGGSQVARSVHYNEQESMLLVSLDAEGGCAAAAAAAARSACEAVASAPCGAAGCCVCFARERRGGMCGAEGVRVPCWWGAQVV
jgi:coatomer protein complex subunit alpha (xenin)